ncbi:MAG: hypothetical protein PHF21_00370 [Bacilli bacterium]|nr:hypothetical protein [Bacilli bacterium]
MKKGSLKLSMILISLLFISIIFIDKHVYLAPNLSVSISFFIYAFSFLIPILIINKTRFKDAKNIVEISAKSLLLFFLLITLLCSIQGNLESLLIDDSLRSIFAPNSIIIKNIIIHYPNLNLLALILVYYFSHNILISVYEALNYYTNKYLSYSLAVFIAFIIDTMFAIPLIYIKDIYYANLDILGIVKLLTAAFMVVIFMSLLMILMFILNSRFQKKKKN